MRVPFLKTLLAIGLLASPAMAFSLYDVAPPVGMPESYAVKYSVYMTSGYDDNLNSSSSDPREGAFVQCGVGAKYSDQESTTRISYDVSLGARLYNEAAEGTDRDLFSESSLKASLSHSFSAASVYTTSINMSMSTEPNYYISISSPYDQGEYFNWSWSHAYSRAIDTRWSWTASLAYSGQLHTRGAYKVDDRQYLTGGLTFSYRYSPLTTYNVSSSYRRDFRSEGVNSDNIYLNLGLDHSLTPISSAYATVGVQFKTVAGNSDLYPNLRFGYRRKIVEGLSANIYVSYDNENINTGYRARSMYLSDASLRMGADLSYTFTHKVSFSAGVNIVDRKYSKHTGGQADRSESTWVASVGMRYKFTKHLSGSLEYRHTTNDREVGSYDRNRISAGLVYAF